MREDTNRALRKALKYNVIIAAVCLILGGAFRYFDIAAPGLKFLLILLILFLVGTPLSADIQLHYFGGSAKRTM